MFLVLISWVKKLVGANFYAFCNYASNVDIQISTRFPVMERGTLIHYNTFKTICELAKTAEITHSFETDIFPSLHPPNDKSNLTHNKFYSTMFFKH